LNSKNPSFSFQAKEPKRLLTVICNEHEKKRLLTSGFKPIPSPSRLPCGSRWLLKFRSRSQWRDRIRFSRISVLSSQTNFYSKELTALYNAIIQPVNKKNNTF